MPDLVAKSLTIKDTTGASRVRIALDKAGKPSIWFLKPDASVAGRFAPDILFHIAVACLVLAGLGPLSRDGLDDAVDLLNAAGTVAVIYVIMIYIPRFIWALCRGQDNDS